MSAERKPVHKAVLPAAGLGTRMLSATKAVPKEMLPLLGKPMIQYAVEECQAAGIEEVIVVTRPGESAIEKYFAADPELEALLERRKQYDLVEAMRCLSRSVKITFVRQDKPKGLGHAVLCAKPSVEREPFAVLLADVFLLGQQPAIGQLLQAREREVGSLVAVERVLAERISQCGIVAVEKNTPSDRLFRVRAVVEKPEPSDAPSDLGIMGRYVLEPEIFDYLARTKPGSGDEVQLTDALAMLAKERGLWAFLCEGESFDAGDRDGFFQLSVELALRDPKLATWLQCRFGVPPAIGSK